MYKQFYFSIHKILSLNKCIDERNHMYEYLFNDCFKYFYNSRIILLILNNFKDKIVNFLFLNFFNEKFTLSNFKIYRHLNCEC